ncbi:MAG: hypothetical protein ACR2O0_04140 [Rhizobiaceae bacterium]
MPEPRYKLFSLTDCGAWRYFPTMGQSRSNSFALLILSALFVQGCSSTNASIPADMIESLDNGVLAGDLGDPLGAKARKLAVEAEYKALEAGQTGMPVPWKLTDNVYGNVVPQQPYSVGAVNCRRYVHTINSKGEIRSATGTACRNDEGIWQPLS